MTNNITFAITHKENDKEVLKFLNIPGEDKEVAQAFAEDEFNNFKDGLQLTIEDFE